LVGFYSHNIAIDERIAYCVTYRKESLSGSHLDMEKRFARIQVFARAYKFFQAHKISVREDRHIRQLLRLLLIFDFFNYRKAKQILLKMNYSNYEIYKLHITTLIYEIIHIYDKYLLKRK
jgi:hypothetical protein